MERYRVTLNETKHTIGLAKPGVLSVFVTTRNRLEDQPDDEPPCKLEMGGLESATETHFNWNEYALQPGDKVTIEILSSGEFDPPIAERRDDPERKRESKRKTARMLAEELGWTWKEC